MSQQNTHPRSTLVEKGTRPMVKQLNKKYIEWSLGLLECERTSGACPISNHRKQVLWREVGAELVGGLEVGGWAHRENDWKPALLANKSMHLLLA